MLVSLMIELNLNLVILFSAGFVKQVNLPYDFGLKENLDEKFNLGLVVGFGVISEGKVKFSTVEKDYYDDPRDHLEILRWAPVKIYSDEVSFLLLFQNNWREL